MDSERHAVRPAAVVVVALAAVLGLALVSGALARERSSAAGSATFVVAAASPGWFDTGLVVPRGASVQLAAASNATCHAPTGPNCEVGSATGQLCSAFGLHAGPAGDAVPFAEFAGRVGPHGKPFPIEQSATATGPGRLFLVYNDCAPPAGYGDNAGGATITVSGGRSARPKRPRQPVAAPPKPKNGTVVGQVTELNGEAFVTRAGETKPLTLYDKIRFGDIVATGKKSSLAFDFSLGGRTGIAPSTEVTVGERSVGAGGLTTLSAELNVAASVGKLKEPLEIPPAGQNGVAIKG